VALNDEARAPALGCRGLVVELAGRPVVNGVQLGFPPGWTALVGPNGAGKSTLLRALAGLLVPAAGEVRLGGAPLASQAAGERAKAIAWLPQGGQGSEAAAELDVRATVALGRLPHRGLFGAMRAEDEAAVDAALAAMQCEGLQARPLAALSGGERQRVHLARVLATGARVLLLDEPTTHLDPPHQAKLAAMLAALAPGTTIVTVLHDLNLALAADRVVVMREGRVLASGDAADGALHEALADAFDGAVQVRAVPAAPGEGRRGGPRFVAITRLPPPASSPRSHPSPPR
jgi:iron complex transport system ATP-binding protein